MKRNLFLIKIMMLSFNSIAQCDTQFSIKTDVGIRTVSLSSEGRDMIQFELSVWDEMFANTRYVSGNLPVSCTRDIYLEIASKINGRCDKGVGFSCSVYDRLPSQENCTRVVGKDNRICSATLIRKTNAVTLIFNDRVDWAGLQDCEQYAGR